MIEFDHVSFSFPDKRVLDDICFHMEDGEFVGILGPNGGGKSTFLRLALGLLKPSKGRVIWKEKKISYIAQTTSMADASFPATVEEIVSLGLVDYHLFFMNKEKKKKVEEMLSLLNLTSLRKKNIQELSGGQQQRVAIARALAAKPAIVLADEPTGNLDSKTSQDVLSLLKVTGQKFSQTIVMITHNEAIAQMADRIIRIEDGHIIKGGEPND